MSAEKYAPQFEGVVQLQSALMGLTWAFQARYGDAALEIANRFIQQLAIATESTSGSPFRVSRYVKRATIRI